MNESIPQQIRRLGRELISSARARDWPALGRADAEVAALLRRLTPVPAALKADLEQLRKAHWLAQGLAREEADRLDQQLRRLNDHQDGLRAYQQMEGLE